MVKEGLMYGQELSDETLAKLMAEVTEEVIRKSKIAEINFKKSTSLLIAQRKLEVNKLINNG